jgi:pyruvyltransferase
MKKATARPLRVFWSRGRGDAESGRNAGDWFSPLICERLSGRPVEFAPPRKCDLVAVGSLLQRLNKSHRLHRLGVRRSLTIWGSGSLRAEDRLKGTHYVHAVRGRRSLAQFEQTPASPALGDPGLLADLLLDKQVQPRTGIGVIPHMVDRGHPEVEAFAAAHAQAKLLDITSPVVTLLEQIAACERIVSSSLHGLVFADALSVPNQWFVASEQLLGGRHKFKDYYSVFDLDPEPIHLPCANVADLCDGYARPGIEARKNALMEAFPFR